MNVSVVDRIGGKEAIGNLVNAGRLGVWCEICDFFRRYQGENSRLTPISDNTEVYHTDVVEKDENRNESPQNSAFLIHSDSFDVLTAW